MFVSNGGSVATNERGIEISAYGRDFFLYKEGDRILRIYVEIDNFENPPPLGIDLYFSAVENWDAPYENEKIDETKLNEIRHNLEEAMIAIGYKPVFK